MKLNRGQLRRLIESVIYEDAGDYDEDGKYKGPDLEKEHDRLFRKGGLLKQLTKKNPEKKEKLKLNFKKIAEDLNKAMRGTADTGAVSGLLKSFGLDAINPQTFGTQDEDLLKALRAVKKYSDQECEDVARILGYEHSDKEHFFGFAMEIIHDEYNRLFSRNLKDDLNGDLNQNDKNNLEREIPGIKDYLDGT